MRKALSGIAAAILMACSPQAGADTAVAASETQDAATTHPVSGLEVVPLTVTSGDTVHRFRAEVADTPEAQTRGLMFRTELGPDEAMIFPRDDLRPARFWMKNTPIPLDIIFIGPDGRIANIAAMTTPYSLDGVESEGAVSAILEIAGGRAAELGIASGDAVAW
ncbi:DUF192 domain-containing protein [Erythrobacter litoralis]|uniref:DUF192 domain-containing protein n=1 Tax=Erythrobacter litoralis (strain HTCC2594) TaxID=314225 RepID=Q2N7M2_ERYLH|nr:DUF192 domain-containing protein [Erythrobacter litoralis]ABC64319.1 hypothetical protein ELI_11135 [Erythrobacter litoralis HTCC2594]